MPSRRSANAQAHRRKKRKERRQTLRMRRGVAISRNEEAQGVAYLEQNLPYDIEITHNDLVAWVADTTKIVSKSSSSTVQRLHVASLCAGRELYDQLVDAYFHLLCKHFSTTAFSSSIYTSIITHNRTDIQSMSKKLRHKGIAQFLWPVCYRYGSVHEEHSMSRGCNHWVLLVGIMNQRVIRYYNSCVLPTSFDESKVCNALQGSFRTHTPWRVERIACPSQQNLVDCGVCVILFGRAFLNRTNVEDLRFDVPTMNKARLCIAREILAQTIDMSW